MPEQMSVDERDARANSRDAQIDADTLRRQAARSRQPRKASLLTQAETLELQSAGWLATARTFASGILLVASLAAWQPASACEAFGECTARAVMQEQQDRAQQARMDQLTQDNQRLQTEARDTELRSVLGIDPWSSPRR